jgi:hypothetical protein
MECLYERAQAASAMRVGRSVAHAVTHMALVPGVPPIVQSIATPPVRRKRSTSAPASTTKKMLRTLG